jgi:hypothetical protein
MLSTSENVDLGDASVGVARNPLRDGALPTGHFTGAFLPFEGILLLPLPRQNPRSLSPHFIVSRVSSFTTWVTACDGSPCGWLRRGVTVTGFGIRQNHASPHLKDDWIESEKHLLARPPMRKAKCQLFLGTTSRGACVAPVRARLASGLESGPKRPRSHLEPLSSSGVLRTLSLASCRHRRGATSKNSCSEARGLRFDHRK